VKSMILLVAGFIILLAVLLLPASTTAYWEAWAYVAVLFIPMTLTLVFLLKTDPELLERRMRTKEKSPEQSFIVKARLALLWAHPSAAGLRPPLRRVPHLPTHPGGRAIKRPLPVRPYVLRRYRGGSNDAYDEPPLAQTLFEGDRNGSYRVASGGILSSPWILPGKGERTKIQMRSLSCRNILAF
jgi:hypothetical protein